jgi:hypothetical protein
VDAGHNAREHGRADDGCRSKRATPALWCMHSQRVEASSPYMTSPRRSWRCLPVPGRDRTRREDQPDHDRPAEGLAPAERRLEAPGQAGREA